MPTKERVSLAGRMTKYVDTAGRRSVAVLAATLVWAACFGPPAIAATEIDQSVKPGFPVTIDKVWCKGIKAKSWNQLRSFRWLGDLTVTEEALEFVGKKKALTIPLDSVRIVSLGKLKGDVNTDWIVLELAQPGGTGIIGFRDGAKLGYGQRTEEMFFRLRGLLQQLGAAQFSAPPGFVPYTKFDTQAGIFVPEGWNEYAHAVVYEGDARPAGSLIFSPQKLVTEAEVEEALRGQRASILVHLSEQTRGMSCDGFSEKARTDLLDRAASDLVADYTFQVANPPQATAATISGCQGLRIRGHSRSSDGIELWLDRRVVAHGRALFVIELRSSEADPADLVETLDRVAAGLRFAAAHR